MIPSWHKKLTEEGWVLIPNLLTSSMITELLTNFERLRSSDKKPSNQILFTHTDSPVDTPDLSTIMTQWLNPWRWEEFSIESSRYLKKILFEDATNEWLLFQEMLFDKQPGQGKFHWHQDMPFFPIDNPNGFTCWVALDYCTKDNGSLIIAPHSHLYGANGSVNLHTGNYQVDNGIPFDAKKNLIVQPNLKPGDALLFHPYTFHASEPNYSNLSRRAWSTVWFKKGVKWEAKNAPNHPMLKESVDKTIIKGII